jgi:hypothetical protein
VDDPLLRLLRAALLPLLLRLPAAEFIGDVTFEGETIEYAAFVAPALLASSAMNGAFYDATNVFWKLRYGKVYESILATPVGPKDVAVGETIWAVVRAMLYSTAYLLVIVVLGLVDRRGRSSRCPRASSSASRSRAPGSLRSRGCGRGRTSTSSS